MANAMYNAAKEDYLGGVRAFDTDAIRCVLVDTGVYTFNAAHTSYDALAGAVVGSESGLFTTKTITGGVANAADITFTAVTGVTVEAIVVFYDSGLSSTDTLLCYIDSATAGLPVTPNGTDIAITWNASGIFAI